ncbi:MAG: hypothetical protein ACRC67_01385 [Inquilinus sp.]|uniref:hypothetical protein n=1 Tax=Inquilinus sp. TaxID=1932117 RepID=UPI003F410B9C
MRRSGILAAAAVLLSAVPAVAGVPQSEFIEAGAPASLAPFLERISAAEGGWTADNVASRQNPPGCVGFFQLCPEAPFSSYYSGTQEQFKQDRPGQVQAYLNYAGAAWNDVKDNFSSILGRSATYGGKTVVIDESAAIFAMQFGGRIMKRFIDTGYACGSGTADGNGTTVCKYFVIGAGYDVSAITGQPYSGQVPVEPGVPPMAEGGPAEHQDWMLEMSAAARKRYWMEKAWAEYLSLEMEMAASEVQRRKGLLVAMQLLSDLDRLEEQRRRPGPQDGPSAGVAEEEGNP